jgi:hypothetical protein
MAGSDSPNFAAAHSDQKGPDIDGTFVLDTKKT